MSNEFNLCFLVVSDGLLWLYSKFQRRYTRNYQDNEWELLKKTWSYLLQEEMKANWRRDEGYHRSVVKKLWHVPFVGLFNFLKLIDFFISFVFFQYSITTSTMVSKSVKILLWIKQRWQDTEMFEAVMTAVNTWSWEWKWISVDLRIFNSHKIR